MSKKPWEKETSPPEQPASASEATIPPIPDGAVVAQPEAPAADVAVEQEQVPLALANLVSNGVPLAEAKALLKMS